MKHFEGFIIRKTDYSGKTTVSLTCCKNIPEIFVGEINLYEELQKMFNQDSEEYFESSYLDGHRQVMMAVKYVILDNKPAEEKSFNDLAADAINGMLMCEYESGCYSEYTCGYGGFDFLVNQHSLFDELAEHEGKYIHLVI